MGMVNPVMKLEWSLARNTAAVDTGVPASDTMAATIPSGRASF